MRAKTSSLIVPLLLLLGAAKVQGQTPSSPSPHLGDAPSTPAVAPRPSAGSAPITLSLRTAPTQPISITPSDNTVGVGASAPVIVQFSGAILPSSVNAASLRVRGKVSGEHAGSYALSAGNTVVTFTPSAPFMAGEQVIVQVTDKVLDAGGIGVLPIVAKYHVGVVASEGRFNAQGTYNHFSALGNWCIKAHDMNGDGYPDLLCSVDDILDSRAIIYYGDGSGNFPGEYLFPWGLDTYCSGSGKSLALDVGDMNGDGKPDLVGAAAFGTGCASVMVRLNDGSGGPNYLPTTFYPVPDQPDQIVLDDFDGDGDLDVVSSGGGYAGLGTSQVTVFLNHGDGTLNAGTQYATGFRSFGISPTDLDHDGDVDLLVANSSHNNLSVMSNDGFGAFVQTATYPVGSLPRDVNTPDLNGDGLADVVVTNQGSIFGDILTTITTYLNMGGGVLGSRRDYYANGSPVGADNGDLDGDNDLDVVTANWNNGFRHMGRSFSSFSNNGGLLYKSDFEAGFLPLDVALADLNNDGSLDLAACHRTGALTVHYNTKPNVVGRVILDLDGSCDINDPAEGPLGSMLMIATDETGSQNLAYTREDGEYFFSLPVGHVYGVKLARESENESTCPFGSGHEIIYDLTGGIPPGKGDDIIWKTGCEGFISGNILLPLLCPGCTIRSPIRTPCPCETFTYQLRIDIDKGAVNTGSTFSIQLPPWVKPSDLIPTFIGSGSGTVAYSGGSPLAPGEDCPTCNPGVNYGGVLTFTNTTVINPAEPLVVNFNVCVAQVPADGRILEFHTTYTPSSIGAGCNLNEFMTATELRCSGDPNDKKVVPQPGLCEPPVSPEEWLYYTVRFQNVGTAPAWVVEVHDEMDEDLDMGTFTLLGSSHTITSTHVLNGSEWVWRFEGILLPSVVDDDAGSIGWIKYMIKPKPDITPGSIVDNEAVIYFDNNESITTNTTLNQIGGDLSSAAQFTYSQNFDCFFAANPRNYQFEYTGDAPVSSYLWSFGPDATPSNATSSEVDVTFASNGTKTATLTITLEEGCTRTKTITFNVNGLVPVCHVTPVMSTTHPRLILRYDENTLYVPMAAMASHLAHGDYCGPCRSGSKGVIDPVVVRTEMHMELAPNPASSEVEVIFGTGQGENVSITVFDYTGRMVAKVYQGFCEEDGKALLDVSALPQGVFFVKMEGSSESITRKLVVNH